MPLGEVIPQTGTTRIKEDHGPAIRTGGKIQSLKQQKRSLETFLTRLSRTSEAAKSPEGFLRNQDAIRTILTAVYTPG